MTVKNRVSQKEFLKELGALSKQNSLVYHTAQNNLAFFKKLEQKLNLPSFQEDISSDEGSKYSKLNNLMQ